MKKVKYSSTHSDKETALYWVNRYLESAKKESDKATKSYLDSGKTTRSKEFQEAVMRLEIQRTMQRLKNKLLFEFDDTRR